MPIEGTPASPDSNHLDRPVRAADPQAIVEGRTTLGIELGSSRIKAVLIGPDHEPLATGGFAWENQLVDRLWTYSLEAAWQGLQACYRDLAADVLRSHGVQLSTVGAIGISGMMHGYLAFDASGDLLVPFRTWRNTNTGAAAEQLSKDFDYNIPHRWSVAHLYQAILSGEDHVGQVDYLTTLAGYIHWQLTGQKILGIGDASGMFPIDITAGDYDASLITTFNRMAPRRVSRWTWPRCCPPCREPVARPANSPPPVPGFSTPPASCRAACPCAHPKVTPVPAWSPPTPSHPAPATSALAPASSPWSCSSTS